MAWNPKFDRRQVLLGAGAGGLALGLGSVLPAFAAGETFRIGALNPVTGAGGSYGPGMQKMIIAAAAEVNAAGGAGGRKLEVFAEDTQTTPDAAVLAVKKLIEVNKVQAVMGTWSSGITLAVMPITTAAGVPLMCTSGASAISTDDKADLVWRFQATVSRFGQAFAKIAAAHGFKHPATMAFNNASGIGNTEGFKTAWEAMGNKLVAQVVYEPKRPSYRSELQQVLAANPDVIVCGSYLPDTTIFLREWYQMGNTNKWIIPGWAANSKLVDALGSEVTEGIISVESIANEEASSFKRFGETYRKETGGDPGTNIYASMTYDMVISFALAMEAAGAGASPGAINSKMRDVSNPGGKAVFSFEEGKAALKQGAIDYQGASSRLDFDEFGDVTPNFGESLITGGKLVRQAIIKI